jgi:hypothetical protein
LNRRSDISLGDLLCAFRELEADEATKLAIARLLKLTPFASLEEYRSGAGPDDSSAPDEDAQEEARRKASRSGAGRDDAAPAPAAAPQPEAEELPADVGAGDSVPSRLEQIGDDKVRVPPPKTDASFLPKDAAPDGARPPAFEPLLFPIWTRAILSGALSTRRDDGPLDIRRVVEQVASGAAVAKELPRLPRPTLARGIHVLVDRSETMSLFLEDQRWLEAEILKVVGPGRAQVLYFDGCPARKAGPGSRSRWKPYFDQHLPRRGTVLLLLTDLGVGRTVSLTAPVSTQEWVAFAERLRPHGCPLVALVPYSPERCPAELRRLMTIIRWDRTTSVATVHARVGKGHIT